MRVQYTCVYVCMLFWTNVSAEYVNIVFLKCDVPVTHSCVWYRATVYVTLRGDGSIPTSVLCVVQVLNQRHAVGKTGVSGLSVVSRCVCLHLGTP